jgi:hypothetical protein
MTGVTPRVNGQDDLADIVLGSGGGFTRRNRTDGGLAETEVTDAVGAANRARGNKAVEDRATFNRMANLIAILRYCGSINITRLVKLTGTSKLGTGNCASIIKQRHIFLSY